MKLGSNRKSIGMGAGYREFSFDNKRVDTYQWQWSMFVWHVSSLHFTFRSVLDFVKGMIILEVKEEKSLMTLLSLWANKWTLSWKGWRKPRKSEWESEKDKSRTKKEGLVTRQWRRKLSLRGWPKIRSGGRERETLEVQILWEISFLMIAFLIGKQTILINLSLRRHDNEDIHGLLIIIEQQMYWMDDKVRAEVLRMQWGDVSASQDISMSAGSQPVPAVSNADWGKGDTVIIQWLK